MAESHLNHRRSPPSSPDKWRASLTERTNENSEEKWRWGQKWLEERGECLSSPLSTVRRRRRSRRRRRETKWGSEKMGGWGRRNKEKESWGSAITISAATVSVAGVAGVAEVRFERMGVEGGREIAWDGRGGPMKKGMCKLPPNNTLLTWI